MKESSEEFKTRQQTKNEHSIQVQKEKQINIRSQQNQNNLQSNSKLLDSNHLNLSQQKQIIDLLAKNQGKINSPSSLNTNANYKKIINIKQKPNAQNTQSQKKVNKVLETSFQQKQAKQKQAANSAKVINQLSKKQIKPLQKIEKKVANQQKTITLVKKQEKAVKEKKQLKSLKQIKDPRDKKLTVKQKQKQKVNKEQQSQYKVIAQKKVECSLLQINLNEMLVPIDPNIQVMQNLQQIQITSARLIRLYNEKNQRIYRYLVQPISIAQSSNVSTNLLFTIDKLTKLSDIEIKLQSEFIFAWLVQILFNLHPNNSPQILAKSYIKIQQSNIYVVETPFLPSLMQRKQQFCWQNPFRILATSLVKNQKQYFQQMYILDEKFKLIKNFEDLQEHYYLLRFNKLEDKIFTVDTVVDKILQKQVSKSVNQSYKVQAGPLSQQNIKWIRQIIGIKKQKTYLYYKASDCNFNPIVFWQKIRNLQKTDHKTQLLILQIEGTPNKLVGFSSSLLDSKNPHNSNIISQYIPDNTKSSALLNISQKTIHQLREPQYAFSYNNQVLLCIGKCDIVLSAFNITNLCYFPVSYSSDEDQVCFTAQSLCGAKKFKLKQVAVYRFSNQQQLIK